MKFFEKIKNNQTRTIKILGFSYTYDRNKFKRNKISVFAKIKNTKLLGGNKIDKNTKIFAKVKDGCIIGRGTDIGENNEIIASYPENKIIIGDNCCIGHDNIIVGGGNITIGNGALLASYIKILASNHNYSDISQPVKFQGNTSKDIIIGDNGWIGDNVIILAGVKIGNHCIIGGGSVVTKDIPSYSVAVGNPARIVKRYNFETKKWERC